MQVRELSKFRSHESYTRLLQNSKYEQNRETSKQRFVQCLGRDVTIVALDICPVLNGTSLFSDFFPPAEAELPPLRSSVTVSYVGLVFPNVMVKFCPYGALLWRRIDRTNPDGIFSAERIPPQKNVIPAKGGAGIRDDGTDSYDTCTPRESKIKP